MDPYHQKEAVIGVDFSGAKDAGAKIWISYGAIHEDAISISDCFQAKDLPGSGPVRELGIRALVTFISGQKDSIIGMDFPFGIPYGLVKEQSWEEWVSAFPERYTCPEHFKKVCQLASKSKELKRVADIKAKTPFSLYNLRLYPQTYFGIRDLLRPLIQESAACVLPMQKPREGKPWVIEVCPASTLKVQRLTSPYKGRGNDRKAVRGKILSSMQRAGFLTVTTSSLRTKIVDDTGADALDSVIAALAVFRALSVQFAFNRRSPYLREGWVYV